MTNAMTAIKASELIEALYSDEIEVEVRNDVECYESIESARLTSGPGEPCEVEYTISDPNEVLLSGIFGGSYFFSCQGVHYTAGRSIDDCDDFIDETLSGRPIEYDINPETGDAYTEDDILEAIHETVDFPAYDPDDYCFQWDEENLGRLYDALASDDAFDEESTDGLHYAVDGQGIVWLFNNDTPMPPNEGFTCITREEAIRLLIENIAEDDTEAS